MRSYHLWSWCAALCVVARAPGCAAQYAQDPQADPTAWINEVDLKDDQADWVYVEILIRKDQAHQPEVPISTLRMQFFTAGGSASHRKLTATQEPLPDVTDHSGSSCATDAHPTQWCSGADNDLFTIRRIYVQKGDAQQHKLPPNGGEWGLALCSGVVALDFVAYTGDQHVVDNSASRFPLTGDANACGVGFHPRMIGSDGTQLVYPMGAWAARASVGRYGTGNKIIHYQWGAYNTITLDALNRGICTNVNGIRNPNCQQNFGDAPDAPPPPTSSTPPSSPTPPPPPTDATACIGHYDECPENCVEVRYHYDVPAPPSGRWEDPALQCHDEATHLPVFQNMVRKCQYGDGSCRPPGCTMSVAPRGARAGACSEQTQEDQRCSVDCDDEHYRVVPANPGPTCDCGALRDMSSDCERAWTNTVESPGSGCHRADHCTFVWDSAGWYSQAGGVDIEVKETGEGFCTRMTTCRDSEYIAYEPIDSPSRDRTCAHISQCDMFTQYQESEAIVGQPGVSQGQDTQCSLLTVCRQDQYESKQPAQSDPNGPNTGDRECDTLRTCLANEFEVTPPQRDARARDPQNAPYRTNRVCQACSRCTRDEYIRTPCSTRADTDCAPLTVCEGDTEEAEPPGERDGDDQFISNRFCVAEAGRCTDDQFERQSEIRMGYTNDITQEYVHAHPRICNDLRQCGQDQYEPIDQRPSRECAFMQVSTECTQDPSACSTYCADRECLDLTRCPHDHYEDVPPPLCHPGDSSAGNCGDRHCRRWSDACGEGQFQVSLPSASNDRVCQNLRTCGNEQWAQAPRKQDGYNITDRECTDWTQCDPGQYEVTAPSHSGPRVCGPWATCQPNQFEAHAPGPMQPGGWSLHNRVCHPLSPGCVPIGETPGAKFEFAPPTATSDRDCRLVKARCALGEYQKSPPTYYSDRECSPLSVCASDEIQTVAPTASSDRQCKKASAEKATGHDGSQGEGLGAGTITAVVLLLGGAGGGGAAYWQKQEKRKREGLLAEKNSPQEIELDDFK